MHVFYWNKEDRKDYFGKIKEMLREYLPEQEEEINGK